MLPGRKIREKILGMSPNNWLEEFEAASSGHDTQAKTTLRA